MTTTTTPGTVLITGPTGGLGKATTMAIANRPADGRPDLLLVGRPGRALDEITDAARATGTTVHAIGADLARLSQVRDAARVARQLIDGGSVRPLHALVANAGISVADTRGASADGFERTFAVNHLAHAQLIGDLLETFTPPARIVLLGSNTYHQNIFRRILHVPAATWRDPVELARAADPAASASLEAAGVAYSDSKLAILYYAHELQRRVRPGISVAVFEPGFMPGTGLSREHGPRMQQIGRVIERIPGVSSPTKSGPALASIVLDDRWAHLKDGAFVVVDAERDVKPFASDRAREARLWEATTELLNAAERAGA
ncbi:SDR family NAD(P)-dependent oxidoreductase [Streptomyces sp. SID6673]|nr:SDR family NAD(P)-dependent oxidoreductase [Streptomyces sp. SID11726]NEB25655.1 SDR family NAD(P)-dependent oxidoreductase [Streptomyces sp. SID6673]